MPSRSLLAADAELFHAGLSFTGIISAGDRPGFGGSATSVRSRRPPESFDWLSITGPIPNGLATLRDGRNHIGTRNARLLRRHLASRCRHAVRCRARRCHPAVSAPARSPVRDLRRPLAPEQRWQRIRFSFRTSFKLMARKCGPVAPLERDRGSRRVGGLAAPCR